jgi:RNA polymerase sigma factor (sigma-70 family)
LFRRHRRRPEGLYVNQDDDNLGLETLLPSPEADPAEVYVRGVLLDELDAALDELPPAQREVFVAHELEGRSFPELARESGVNVNTLLSRKRYAVLYLRQRLDAIYREFMRR